MSTDAQLSLAQKLKGLSLVEVLEIHRSDLEENFIDINDALDKMGEALAEGKHANHKLRAELRSIIAEAVTNLWALDNDLEEMGKQENRIEERTYQREDDLSTL